MYKEEFYKSIWHESSGQQLLDHQTGKGQKEQCVDDGDDDDDDDDVDDGDDDDDDDTGGTGGRGGGGIHTIHPQHKGVLL